MQSILGQKQCRCGVEYKPPNSGGADYIRGGAAMDTVSKNSWGTGHIREGKCPLF